MSYDVNSHHLSNLRSMFAIISRAPSHPNKFNRTIMEASERLLSLPVMRCWVWGQLWHDIIDVYSCFGIIWFGLMDLLDCNSLISYHLYIYLYLLMLFCFDVDWPCVQSNLFICQLLEASQSKQMNMNRFFVTYHDLWKSLIKLKAWPILYCTGLYRPMSNVSFPNDTI